MRRRAVATDSDLPADVTIVSPPIIIIITAPIPVITAKMLAAELMIFLGPVTRLFVSLPSFCACWQVGASGLFLQGPHSWVLVPSLLVTVMQLENKSKANVRGVNTAAQIVQITKLKKRYLILLIIQPYLK
jgi:hypothetical protein